MGTVNRKAGVTLKTHEGAPAKRIDAEAQLRRSVMACMLWEKTFYEEGKEIAQRIEELVGQVPRTVAANLAVEARSAQHLRHAPLLIARALAELRYNNLAQVLVNIVQRPDELTEFLALYWGGADRKAAKKPLSAQVRKGLAQAFHRFDRYQLGKYKQEDKAIKLRDVLRLVRPKPQTEEQAAWWKQLIDGSLPAPDTWEVALSAGADKKETFARLLTENKLGALAAIRNIRNMEQAGVPRDLVQQYIRDSNVSRVLPFRFIAAARVVPAYEECLEAAMFKAIGKEKFLGGLTLVMVDVSGSMEAALSAKSDMTRMDAAAGVAMIAREICADCRIFTFSYHLVEIGQRHGFALRDAIINSQEHGGTYLGASVNELNKIPHDRIIVITDEQAHDPVAGPAKHGYMINVAPYQHGVGYGRWIHCDGFSEAVVKYIVEYEKAGF